MLTLYIYNNTSLIYNLYNIEQRLLQKLLYINTTEYINELMLLSFEYSFLTPIILTLESTKGYFFTSPLIRFNEILKLNYNIKEFNIINFKKLTNNNSYILFLKLLNSFNAINTFSNALYIMVNSGAKATWNQIYQLIGIRGYLSNYKGIFFKIPIINSFSKGLRFFEYFISCYGARKGILDTALRTADSGYLTRRLVELSQEIIIKEYNCGSKNSIKCFTYIDFKGNFKWPIILIGKNLTKNLIEIKSRKIVKLKNTYISNSLLDKLFLDSYNNLIKLNINSIKLCLAGRSVCSTCYGFSNCSINYLGKNVGILSGQVIGEPGTQLTLRTFHTGGSTTIQTEENYKNLQKYSNLYNFFFKKIKYKLCSKKKYINIKTNFSSNNLIYIKNNYLFKNIYILEKFKYNKIISKKKLIYIKNNAYLSNLILNYLNISKLYQRNNFKYLKKSLTFVVSIFLYKNLLKLIFKNIKTQWISINLNKTLIYKNICIKHNINNKNKLLLLTSSNQRYTKLYIALYDNNIYSYRILSYKIHNIRNNIIFSILFMSNKYLLSLNKINKTKKFIIYNITNIFKNKITLLKFKKEIKN